MNEPTIRLETRPEVAAFVEKVRARLSDLSDEEREDLVGGLEADIDELVSDGGSVAELGDPRAYADELRAAAGFERGTVRAPAGARRLLMHRLSRRRIAERLDGALDAGRRRWSELAEVPALHASWEFLTTVRPVWWVLRAWVAIQLFDIATQGGDLATPVPMIGGPLVGSLIWLAAIVVSVQIGRNKLWPGSGAARKTLPRVVLLLLNTLAVLMMPMALGQFPSSGTWADQYSAAYVQPDPGLSNRGEYVRNIYPYDAQGNPLAGVQLFDQRGNPLNVAAWLSEDFDGDGRNEVRYPWFNGEKRLFNVFPLPEREQPYWRGDRTADAWTSAKPPALLSPPLAVVPPAVLPLAVASEADAEENDADIAAEEDKGDPSDQTSGDETSGDPSDGPEGRAKRDSEKPAGR